MIKIDVEGVDGSGKTTGLKYLIEQIKSKGRSVVETREVGNPHIPICVKLREAVLDPASNMSGKSMELVFSAMREENDRWLKSLRTSDNVPNFVVSDRGWFSHLAYTDHNVSPEFTEMLYLDFMAKTTELPDFVIYFSVNTETALKRRIKRGEGMDVIEMKGVDFQEKVRSSFEKYIEAGSVPIYTIDANESIEGVQSQLDTIIEEVCNYINLTY